MNFITFLVSRYRDINRPGSGGIADAGRRGKIAARGGGGAARATAAGPISLIVDHLAMTREVRRETGRDA